MKARKILISLLLTALPLLCSAQALKGSYFLDNSIDRTRMNPAFAPGANYLQTGIIRKKAGMILFSTSPKIIGF